ncbi:MAG: MOSC domain-containing protein, partial [Tabrizicola sp.]
SNRRTESFRPDDPADAARLIDWLRPLWPENRPEPARVIRVPGQPLTDQDQPLISLNSVSSLADLSERMDQPLSHHRFRGNIWFAGLAPWAELDLIGHEISIGTARLRVEEPIGRCRATGANPETGLQDADTMGALEQHFGHTDFGVFARVISGGKVALGDEVRS